MRRRLWNRTRTGLKAGFGQLESWAGSLRGHAVRTSRLRATNTPALRAETLEPRQMLAATVLSFGAAVPEFRNDAQDSIEIVFSEAVTGFDTSDLLLTVDDGSGAQQIGHVESSDRFAEHDFDRILRVVTKLRHRRAQRQDRRRQHLPRLERLGAQRRRVGCPQPRSSQSRGSHGVTAQTTRPRF